MLTFLLALEGFLAVAGPLVLAWWIRRRWGARWKLWFLGAVTFLVAQLIRLPMLAGLTFLLRSFDLSWTETQSFLVNLTILAVTAGLFEETARYVAFRYVATDARRWRDGLMFGAGHGGIEAMLLVGGAVMAAFILLVTGEPIIAQLQEQRPEQASLLSEQLKTIRNLNWWLPLLAVWERVVAITFHIAATLWVMRAVAERRLFWWLAAVVLHTVFNAAAVLAAKWGGLVFAEVVVTLLWPLFLWIIWHNRPTPTPEPPIPQSRPEA